MKQGFISKLSDYILSTFGGNTDKLNVVFPNKRAAIFLKRELSQQAGKVIWMPQIRTIDEIFAEWAGIKPLDKLSLSLELISVFAENQHMNRTTINQFAAYALQLMHDFEEADNYLVDASMLFQYLSEAKAMELWHPDGSLLSEYERDYLAFYQSLGPLYDQFKKKMRDAQARSAGSNARYLAELSENELLEKTSGRFTLFAGFNAFSPAEEAVFTMLHRNSAAEARWDFDAYYLRPNEFGQHEAGFAAHNFFEKHPTVSKDWIADHWLGSEKKIHFFAVPGQIGQAKALGNNLKSSLNNEFEESETAVVLSDESLLFPVLNSIPNEISQLNITMGLPYASGIVYGFLKALLKFETAFNGQLKSDKISVSSILEILRHPAAGFNVNKDIIDRLNKLINKILDTGSTFVSKNWLVIQQQELLPQANPLFDILLEHNSGKAVDCNNKLIRLFDMLAKQFGENQSETDLITLNQFVLTQKLLYQLQTMLHNKPELLDATGLERIVHQVAPAFSQNLVGEPLEGLQIMGLLETRNLNFKTVHLLSANEGILPRDTHSQSLIPYDIRKSFGLPTRSDSQAIYAFHFFRLLQQADNIFLYYNTEPDNFGGGEMSRFLLQIKYELTRLNTKIALTEETFTFQIKPSQQERSLQIKKTPFVLEKIAARFTEGLSPTGLSRYLNCPLQFYFKDVLKLEELQDSNSSGQANKIGTVVHSTIEMLYKPWLNKTLTGDILNEIENQLDEMLVRSFQEEFPGIQITEGLNKITFTVAQHFIANLLQIERESIKTENAVVLEQEKKLFSILNVNGLAVKIKGTVDRLDLVGKQLRVIDFKTGKAEKKDISLSEAEDFFLPEKSKALQLAIYTWLFIKTNKDTDTIPNSYLFNLSKTSIGSIQLELPFINNTEEFTATIEAVLRKIIEELIDEKQDIIQTNDLKKCSNCTYIAICNRDKKNSSSF